MGEGRDMGMGMGGQDNASMCSIMSVGGVVVLRHGC